MPPGAAKKYTVDAVELLPASSYLQGFRAKSKWGPENSELVAWPQPDGVTFPSLSFLGLLFPVPGVLSTSL